MQRQSHFPFWFGTGIILGLSSWMVTSNMLGVTNVLVLYVGAAFLLTGVSLLAYAVNSGITPDHAWVTFVLFGSIPALFLALQHALILPCSNDPTATRLPCIASPEALLGPILVFTGIAIVGFIAALQKYPLWKAAGQ